MPGLDACDFDFGLGETLDEVRALAHDVLRRHGLGEAHIAPVAATIVAGERDQCASHGVYRLTNCVHTLRAGKVVPDARPVLEDVEPDFPGPLAGIESALQHVKSEWLMVVPCDTPFGSSTGAGWL